MINKKFLSVLFFLVLSVSFAQASFMLDRVVAIVNQEVISWSELHRAMENDASPAVKALPEEEQRKVFRENEAAFLENLIGYRLQIQEAVATGVRVSEEEIKDTVDGIMSKYNMTESQFQASLKAEGYELPEYKRRLAEQIMVSKVVNQLRGKVLVTEPDIDKFLKENKTFADGAEAYHLRQIFFKKMDAGNEKSKIEEKAVSVYTKAMKGEPFPELAKEYSEDATRNAGGDLGLIEKGALAKEFSAALASMKPGDVSRPFWSDRGMHILKLEERSAPKTSADIREEARRILQNKLFGEKYNSWLKSLREKSFIDIHL